MDDIKGIMVAALIEDSKKGLDADIPHEEVCFIVQFQLDKLKEAGFVIVSEDVSPEMLKAGENSASVLFRDQTDIPEHELDVTAVYEAMIGASQGGDI